MKDKVKQRRLDMKYEVYKASKQNGHQSLQLIEWLKSLQLIEGILIEDEHLSAIQLSILRAIKTISDDGIKRVNAQ